MVSNQKAVVSLNALVVLFTHAFVSQACATDQWFADLAVNSPNGRYVLTALSPDNSQRCGETPFQVEFSYTFRDTSTDTALWTRKQPEGEPIKLDDGTDIRTWNEASPVGLYVANDGWSVIWLADDELIVVGRDGEETGKIDVVSDGFTADEKRRYVHWTTAGNQWGLRRSYFGHFESSSYFVIRTWWGRRVVVDLSSGSLASRSDDLNAYLDESERAYVCATLETAAQSNGLTMETYDEESSILIAALMAGRMEIEDCTGWLRSLENVPYVGSVTMSALPLEERLREGELDIRTYDTFTLRQAVQLSLRRLGVAPKCLAAKQFYLHNEDFSNREPFDPELSKPRAERVELVKKGMQPEEVIRSIGNPDEIGSSNWEFDMDADTPYTLIVNWGETGIESLKRVTPAIWQTTDRRDEAIAY